MPAFSKNNVQGPALQQLLQPALLQQRVAPVAAARSVIARASVAEAPRQVESALSNDAPGAKELRPGFKVCFKASGSDTDGQMQAFFTRFFLPFPPGHHRWRGHQWPHAGPCFAEKGN